jgi:hypothetical protein
MAVNPIRNERKSVRYAHQYLFPDAIVVTEDHPGAQYDLLDGAIRINVKASRLYQRQKGRYYHFLLQECHNDCDYFLLMGYRDWQDRIPDKIWLIPSVLLKERYQLTLGRNHGGNWKEFEWEVTDRP